jgi:lactoylglutathione lyase
MSNSAATALRAAFTKGQLPDATWQQSMLRVKDPLKSLAFYRDVLGMHLIDKYDFAEYKFSLYFLQSLPQGERYSLEPGSADAHRHLWSTSGVTLELTWNWGTEADASFAHHAGNGERDGFGHVAFSVPSLDAAVARLDAAGVLFKKRPEDGRMRSIAFAYDPDKYWIELVEREEVTEGQTPFFSLAQTMLRVRDPAPSLAFYTTYLGMTLVRKSVADTFTVYFLASLPLGTAVPADVSSPEAREFVKSVLYPAGVPVLELTHNHGTEADSTFAHYNGNEEGRRGFGHLGFLVGDVYATHAAMAAKGVVFHKTPDGGSMKGLAFAKDPDGYLVELICRGQDGAW